MFSVFFQFQILTLNGLNAVEKCDSCIELSSVFPFLPSSFFLSSVLICHFLILFKSAFILQVIRLSKGRNVGESAAR